jgi:hypothetical protein
MFEGSDGGGDEIPTLIIDGFQIIKDGVLESIQKENPNYGEGDLFLIFFAGVKTAIDISSMIAKMHDISPEAAQYFQKCVNEEYNTILKQLQE